MVPEQKRAWFLLAVVAVALLVGVALIPLAGVGAWGGLGILGLVGFTPLLFRKKRGPGEVAVDERDKMILEKATLRGGMTSYLWFVLACMFAVRMHVPEQEGDLHSSAALHRYVRSDCPPRGQSRGHLGPIRQGGKPWGRLN